MNRKKNYKDMDKFRRTRNAQKKRYYAKTAIYAPRRWTYEEEMMVLEHSITDTELSSKIGRSVGSIQKRRSILKKKQS